MLRGIKRLYQKTLSHICRLSDNNQGSKENNKPFGILLKSFLIVFFKKRRIFRNYVVL